jgi:hypothetical protein
MTDIRPGGLVREALDTAAVRLFIGGVAREALVNTPTVLETGAVVREILLRSPLAVSARQYAVTVNSA